MSFLLMYWKSIAIGTVFIAFCGYIGTIIVERNHYRNAYASDQAEIQSLKDQSDILIKKHEAQNATDKARYEADNQEIKDVYDKQLAAAKRRGNGNITCRVRVPTPDSSGHSTPTQTETSTGTDGTTTDPVVIERVASLPVDCAITTAQVVGLQKFVAEECLDQSK